MNNSLQKRLLYIAINCVCVTFWVIRDDQSVKVRLRSGTRGWLFLPQAKRAVRVGCIILGPKLTELEIRALQLHAIDLGAKIKKLNVSRFFFQ